MHILYLDCFSGISGDMTLGALLDLGVDENLFRSELDKLNLTGYRILIEKTNKKGITGTDVTVILEEEHCPEEEHHNHPHIHGRNLYDIETIIDRSTLKQSIKNLSKKIFREIAVAESIVHNKNISEIHFHEVGALDSIIDITGSAICLDLLGITKVCSSVLHDGKGFIECQHGTIPVPVPAVLQMLSGTKIPLIQEDVDTELITPTGMGIVKCLSSDFGNMPAMIIDRIGYGFGKRETGRLNALRAVMGTPFDQGSMMEEVSILETNIDDMSPELIGYTLDRLLKSGAMDVFQTPIYMKKNRPAVMLSVICSREKEQELMEIIFRETTTLGVRRIHTSRCCMDRKTVSVETVYGKARVKEACYGDFTKAAPEYEDCKQLAEKSGLALREVYRLVEQSYRAESDSVK